VCAELLYQRNPEGQEQWWQGTAINPHDIGKK
jgi:hypothetical protein